jgi:hypothetical protein
MKHVLQLNQGSDCAFAGTLRDDLGVPVNLTGYTISAFDPSPELAPHLTLSITDAVSGAWSGRIEWDAGFPDGMRMRFRIKFSSGLNDQTWPPIWIDVQ